MKKQSEATGCVAPLWAKARRNALFAAGLAILFAGAPLSTARPTRATPAELLQSELPANKTLTNASDVQLLEAVYRSIKQVLRQTRNKNRAREDAALIVRTAADARRPLRSDLLCIAARSLKENGALNCAWEARILHDWLVSDPKSAGQLMEVMSECSSDCREAMQMAHLEIATETKYVNPPPNINPPPGSGFAAIGGASSEETCVVCQDGFNINIACSQVDAYLRDHPGSARGSCQTSPTKNK
jgi:hypothetical protein